MRRILVFTGTRAEYGLLRNLIRGLAQRAEVNILASGAHISGKYGKTISEIEKDGLVPVLTADIGLEDNTPVGICSSMGCALAAFGPLMQQFSPDILVLLGDRYEAFCAASAAAILRIPVAHLHGGEITEGAIDNSLRHAITKLSHLHFTSCAVHRNRVIQMGEEPDRVWDVGSPGIENLSLVPVHEEEAVREYLGLTQDAPYLLATWHPVTLEAGNAAEEAKIILEVAGAVKDLHIVFTGANADAGGDAVNEYLKKQASGNENIHFFMSLGAEHYINAARYSMGVIGNSSSGIVEIPGLGIPVLDIGNRQKGRDRPESVLHADLSKEKIAAGIRQLLSPEARDRARRMASALRRRNTSKEIADILLEIPLDGLISKSFYDFQSGSRLNKVGNADGR